MSANTPAHADSGRDRGPAKGRGSADERSWEQEHPLEDKGQAPNDPKAIQALHLEDTPDLSSLSALPLDLKATQNVRLADAPSDAPTRPEPDLPSAPDTAPARFALRPWMARHKRALIVVAVLVGIAILAISGAAIKNAQGIQQSAVGIGGPQMRAARLAQADLSGQDLKWANLSQADLRQADLSGADLLGADLSGADLGEANLDAAVLRGADLSGAKVGKAVLTQADLHWAVMRNADLRQADLREANLQWADLENANLEGANLEGANLSSAHTVGTILPDGSVWTPRTNLRRFTDPTYPQFWRPGDAQSVVRR